MKKEKRSFLKILMGLMLLFFYLPIGFMIVFSFNSSKSLTHFTGFSMQWYTKMLSDASMMESLYITILVAVIATVISTVVGTISAIGLSKSKKVVHDLIMQINDFPLMNPEIVTAIGLMLFFITFNIEKGFATLLLAHIAFCIPYVILSVMPKIRSLDPNLADAAMDLGCTPWMALIKVIVPQIMPGIVSGALIAFTMSFDDFIISYFVTGKGIKNLSIMVYTMSKRVNPSINAISTLIVIFITIVLILVNVVPVIREKRKVQTTELKEKNISMENIIAKEEFLKNEYNLYLKNKENLLSANVIALDNNSLFVRFNINKGSKDGVKVGDIIVQGTVGDKENTYIKAVVGKVVEVGYNWSKVSSLVDSASNVSFNVVRTQSYGAINGQENNLLSGFMYKSDADVVVGDKLVTSGRGGVFPRNLYIGEVTEVKSSENNLEKKVSVKSPVDFTTLFRVFVLKGNGESNE